MGRKFQQPTKKTEDELQEEEDLQMAIALSQSEAENKEKERERAARMKSSSSPTYNFKAGRWWIWVQEVIWIMMCQKKTPVIETPSY